jgi:hypothetical protein
LIPFSFRISIPNMNRSRRSQNALDRLQAAGALTPAGKDWILAAVDPFHDTDFDLKGYPDLENSATIVQLVKRQVVITGSTAPGGGAWDCHLSLLPNLTPVFGDSSLIASAPVMDTYRVAPTLYTGTTDNACPSGLAIQQVAAGANSWQTITSGITANPSNVAPGSNFCGGNFRVIGMGFEVHNTTAELYKQGSVTVYTQSARATTGELYAGVSALAGSFTAMSPTPSNFLLQPPYNLDQTMLLRGSRTWDAADGCYVVSKFNSIENPLKTFTNRPTVFLTTEELQPVGGFNEDYFYPQNSLSTPVSINRYDVGGSAQVVTVCAPDYIAPFDISGAYFAGLSPQTSLTIDVRWYIERNPSANDENLVVLAQPSPCYDPLALRIYSECSCGLPPGVPVSMNPAGEFFRMVADNIRKYAGPVLQGAGSLLQSVPHPLAQGAGAVFQVAGRALTSAQEKRVEKRVEKDLKRITNVPTNNVRTPKVPQPPVARPVVTRGRRLRYK